MKRFVKIFGPSNLAKKIFRRKLRITNLSTHHESHVTSGSIKLEVTTTCLNKRSLQHQSLNFARNDMNAALIVNVHNLAEILRVYPKSFNLGKTLFLQKKKSTLLAYPSFMTSFNPHQIRMF